jgi:hypothetical protein
MNAKYTNQNIKVRFNFAPRADGKSVNYNVSVYSSETQTGTLTYLNSTKLTYDYCNDCRYAIDMTAKIGSTSAQYIWIFSNNTDGVLDYERVIKI